MLHQKGFAELYVIHIFVMMVYCCKMSFLSNAVDAYIKRAIHL